MTYLEYQKGSFYMITSQYYNMVMTYLEYQQGEFLYDHKSVL